MLTQLINTASKLAAEFLIIIFLVLLNGLFALSEMAIVSARKARLRARADQGSPGAAAALEISNDPSAFLSTIQVGITLIGILTGVFAGASITDEFVDVLESIIFLAPFAHQIGFSLVVVVITLLSLIFGELVPKRLALAYGESVAIFVARPMRTFAAVTSPLVRMLGYFTDLILKVLRVPKVVANPVTEEEFRILLEEGHEAGVFEDAEKQIVSSALGIGNARVKNMMTPREDVIWLNTEDSLDAKWELILTSGHTYLPVCERSFDNILGLVSVKDVLGKDKQAVQDQLKGLIRKPLYVPDTANGVQVLEEFKRSGQHIALVVDEHGNFEGLITLIDILEEIVGELPSADDEIDPEVVVRPDGSWLIDGRYPINDLQELLELENLPEGANRIYHSLAGLVMDLSGSVPRSGARFEYEDCHFEVVDMDGRRIDKVLVSKRKPAATV